ncbi:putative membrane protein [Lysobacter dokdonensis DS-58]|uniref:Putative membrane protein n=1 Tax=Lysobacter dokdonensis DS-58 TaxID=1300345 RepID=A0A0A2WLK7_9GAMM|nr:putative membrane protein [Lysobacter dokdonensis DS-58]
MENLLGLAALVLAIIALTNNGNATKRLAALERELQRLREMLAQRGAPPAQAQAEAAPTPAPREAAPPPPRPVPAPPSPTRAVFDVDGPSMETTPGAPMPPPQPAPPRPTLPREPDVVSQGIEKIKRWFTEGNVPVKIGVLVLFAGVAALLKYATDQGWLNAPIELRLAGVAAVALAALVFAWRKRESNRAFALSLQGGAIGILLMVVFAAFKLYGLMPVGVAFAISIVLVFGAGVLAVLQDAKALAFFAVLAGFLAPLWLSTGSGNHVALFSYYAVLNATIFAIAWWKSWRVLNLLGFLFTFGIGGAWGVMDYAPEKFGTTEPFLLLFFAFYLLIPLVHAMRQPMERRDYVDGTLVFATPLVCFAIQAGLLHGARMPLAFNALGLAAIYAVLALIVFRRGANRVLGDGYALLAVGFATLAVPLALSARATASVFALEGAALAWLGVRQQRIVRQLAAFALHAIAAGACVIGFDHTAVVTGTPIANAQFMSLLIVAVGALATAWVYRRADSIPQFAVYYAWGLAWWLVAITREILEFAPGDSEPDLLLVAYAATGWIAAEAHRRRPTTLLILTSLFAILAAFPLSLLQTITHDHPFGDAGALAWLGYAVLGIRSLQCLRTGEHRLAPWAQLLWWLVWPFVASLILYWLIDDVLHLAQGWGVAAIALPWLAMATIAEWHWEWLAVPLRERFDDMMTLLPGLVFLALAALWVVSLGLPGGSHPLPWVPVVNPMEIVQLATIALLWHWCAYGTAPEWLNRVRVLMTALAGFAWITSVVLHAVHHWGGIAWDAHLIGTSLAQTSLTVTWSILGVIGWVLGSKRGQRTLWLAGALLMAVVLLKLLVVDRHNLGNGLGIASFIAFGLLCTVVGYFAPAPPREPASEATA